MVADYHYGHWLAISCLVYVQHYDYEAIYAKMTKPAFVFDGRNILDHNK